MRTHGKLTCLILIYFSYLTTLASAVSDDDDLDFDFDPGTGNLTELKRDIHLIMNAIKNVIVRPEFDKYPYVLSDNVTLNTPSPTGPNQTEVTLTYITPVSDAKTDSDDDHESGNAEGGDQKQVVIHIKSTYIDFTKDVVIFPAGDRGIVFPMKNTYVVFRRSTNNNLKHYMSIVFIRKHENQYFVEWSMLDHLRFGRNRLEEQLCRQESCDIPPHIFGTRSVSSHKCNLNEAAAEALASKYIFKSEVDKSSQNSTEGKKDAETAAPAASNRRKRRASDSSATKAESSPIPNSLDLLLLKRDDKESAIGAEDHFQSTLEAKREATGEEECINCYRWGEFHEDLEEDIEFSKILGKYAIQEKDNSTLEDRAKIWKQHPDIPFIGYGSCNFSNPIRKRANPKKKVVILKRERNTKDIEMWTNFVIKSLRLNCDQESEGRIKSLFSELLEINDDFSVNLWHSYPTLKYKILTTYEFRTLMSALIVSKYAQLFREEQVAHLLDTDVAKAPQAGDVSTERNISRSVRFLTKLMMNVIEAFTKKLSQHFVRGTRFLLRIAKDKFLALLQSNVNAKKVILANAQGAVNSTNATVNPRDVQDANDLYHIMALKEFIIYGFGPIAKSGTGTEVAFQSFYLENEKRIQSLVRSYFMI